MKYFKTILILFTLSLVALTCANEQNKEVTQANIQGKWKGYDSAVNKEVSWEFFGDNFIILIFQDDAKGTFTISGGKAISLFTDQASTDGGTSWHNVIGKITTTSIAFDKETLIIGDVRYTKQ